MGIEEGFTPETVREMILLERIRQLKVDLYKRGPSFSPMEKEVSVAELSPELRLACSLEAGWQSDYMFRVRATSYGSKGIQVGYYMGWDAVERAPTGYVIDLALEQHKAMLRQVAGLLCKDQVA